jgi:cytochrome-b5 reductase
MLRCALSKRSLSSISTVLPGSCVLGEHWLSLPLLSKTPVNHDTSIFRFALPDSNSPLNLSTCACILASTSENEKNDIVRPYTPISTNSQLGSFELMVKIYPDGKLSQEMNNLQTGDTLDFKHIPFNVKIQYPFNKRRIAMIVGGTGITPMIQALHAILDTDSDTTKVDLIYGSKSQDDILGRQQIDEWAAKSNGQLDVHHILSDEPAESDWTGQRGYVDEKVLKALLPLPEDDSGMIFVCGPPAMYENICGDRTEENVTGILEGMGFSAEHVFKF